MNKLNKKIILTVCHDAGGAEVLSSYVKKNRERHQFCCVVSGPAAAIFKRKKLENLIIEFNNKSNIEHIFEQLGEIDLLLAGTGWATGLELEFVKKAKEKKIKTAACLDHWVNYRERFGYPAKGWKINLPDEIWAGDKDALILAKNNFKGLSSVRYVPNLFFEDIKRDWREFKKNHKLGNAVLFASEPIDAMKYKGQSVEEFIILEKLMKVLVKDFSGINLVIRLHPSEQSDKYRDLIKKYGQTLKISIHSSKENMMQSLLQSSAVIGMKSMFLMVAVICGKKTASFLPSRAHICSLPEERIAKIKNIKLLSNWLKKQ